MTFDPDQFLNQTLTSATSTEYVNVPDGEYPAVISKLSGRQSGDYTILDIDWEIDDETVRELTGLPAPRVRQSVFLDFNGEALDDRKGKNITLGKLRDAVNQNVDGQEWSPNMLLGQIASVLVTSREYNEKTYNDIKSVASL